MSIKNYCKLIVVLLYCLPNIIMPMRTRQITPDVLKQQKAANKALEYKKNEQPIPNNIIAVLDADIKNYYLYYNQRLKNQQFQNS